MEVIDAMMKKFTDIDVEGLKAKDIESNIFNNSSKDIAIIGMNSKMPLADNVDDFWENLKSGIDCIRSLPESRKDDVGKYIKQLYGKEDSIECKDMGYLDDIDKFDYEYFNITPKEATMMDPNQRIFLETAWGAIENAGYGGGRINKSKTGVYVGFTNANEYQTYLTVVGSPEISSSITGNLTQLIASRISYLLDLSGPSMMIDTTCSSSLIALHTACQALRTGDCNMAIAGSVRIHIIPEDKNDRMPIESLSGKVLSFDDNSDGTGWGEGAAAILLKPLNKAIADGDNIFAVIKGSAVNQDGHSNGITAPNPKAQEKLILSALKDAGISPETITYIEAHGTGTKLGDPIEIEGITNAFRAYTDRKAFCGIGSVKTNLGHLGHAAGITGIIKAILSLKNGQIVPSLHFQKPNSKINFEESPLYVTDKLMKWETGLIPKRCAVSSFGMGGTNCHVILEEAPSLITEGYTENDVGLNVLTISAKNESTLINMVNAYDKYLKGDVQNVKDMCFTANTGRGHYSHRLAIVFTSLDELRGHIRDICYEKVFQSRNIFYGMHRVIFENRIEKSLGDISEKELEELEAVAKANIKEFVLKGKEDYSILAELCNLYVKGAAINWNKLYGNEKRRKVALPTYMFDRKRCWIELTDSSRKFMSMEEKGFSSLLDKCIVELYDQHIFVTKFKSSRHWVLNEHRLGDNCILVGTAYIEMVLEASKKYMSEFDMELRDIVFLSPLVLKDGEEIELQTVIKKEQDSFGFVISSYKQDEASGESQWTIHTQGKIFHNKKQMMPHVDVNEISRRCQNQLIKPKFDGFDRISAFEFGSRWNNIKLIGLGENESFSHIELSDEYKCELENYLLYPSLLDNSLINLLWKGQDNYLPFSYKSIKVYGSTPAKFYSHVKLKTMVSDNAEVLVYDLCLLDENGNVFVEIEEYSRKRISNFGTVYDEINIFNKINWKLSAPEENSGTFRSEVGVMIIRDNTGIGCALAKEYLKNGINTIEVTMEEQAKQSENIGENQYSIDGTAESYFNLFDGLKDSNIEQIVYLASIDDKYCADSIDELEETQKKGVYSLFNLVKVLADIYRDEVEIILVTKFANLVTGEEQFIIPENATLIGFGKVINQEYHNLKCRCIDIDNSTSIEEIFSEIHCSSKTYQVTLRDGRRFIEEIGSTNIESLKRDKFELRHMGAYVVTGGTGGIGLEICRFLALRQNVVLNLIGRRILPNRSEWKRILNAGSETEMCKILETFIDIESTGSVVNYFCSDLSDMEKVESILSCIRKEYGTIFGVMHCAGINDDKLIANKDEKAFRQVLLPKVNGTWVLDRLTKDDPLDFYIMFSSIITITGSAGQGDYTAANSYLDAFADYRKRYGRPALTINWAGWEKTGMSKEINADALRIFKPLTSTKAVKIFEEVLNHDVSRLIIGEINYDNDGIYNTNILPIMLSDSILQRLESKKRQISSRSKTLAEKSKKEIRLKGRNDNMYSKTEVELGTIYHNALGFEEIDIYSSFYEIGGDSLSALGIINNVNKVMNVKVKITDLFNHLSIAKFAEFIDTQIKGNSTVAEKTYKNKNIISAEYMEYYPVSSAQKRLFIINRLEGDKTSYNVPVFLKIKGSLKVDRIKSIFQVLIRRHETLRTSFLEIDGEPVQKVHEDAYFDIKYTDLEYKYRDKKNDISDEDISEHIKRFIGPFDLEKAPLLRVELLKLSEDQHVLMYDLHHIIADGISMDIFKKDFVFLYNNQKLPELKLNYKDFAQWHNKLIKADEYEEHKKFFLDVFSGQINTLSLPTDYQRPSVPDYDGRRESFICNSILKGKLNELSLATGATLYMLLLSALNILLSRYSGQDDIIVGSPTSGRIHADLENVMGMFVNTLALRNYPKADLTVREFISNVRQNSLKVYEHQDFQFEDLVDKLGIVREQSHNPLFDVMFVLLKKEKEIFEVDGLRFEYVDFEQRTSKFDITLRALEDENEISFEFEYKTNLFKSETIQRMAGHFLNILNNMTEDLDKRISEIEMLGKEEKQNLLSEYTCTNANPVPKGTLAQCFEEQVLRTPNNIAIVCGNTKLTYRQLDEKAALLGCMLKDKGISSNDIVAVIADNSIQSIISILGIAKAGGAFLPIDNETPIERIKYLLMDSHAKLLLLAGESIESVDMGVEVVNVDYEMKRQTRKLNITCEQTGDDLVYIIYTSGTTGMPKGVQIENHNLINYVSWFSKSFNIGCSDKTVLVSSLSFDLGYTAIFPILLNGGELHILPKNIYMNTEELVCYISDNCITYIKLTPSLFNLIVNETDRLSCSFDALKLVVLGGERIKLKDVETFHNKYSNISFLNHYGPTETTIGSITHLIDFKSLENYGGDPCIGKPIDNTSVYILDKNLNILPVGIPGQIHISGQGVARGYINLPEVNLEKFISNPFHKNDRLYKTGDLGRYTQDGNIEFLGRIDNQVKIRGFRVELKEIENCLLKIQFVKEATAIDLTDVNGNKYICAYVVADRELTVPEIRGNLIKYLPGYMIPAHFVQLEAMPLLQNGKVNRNALPKPDETNLASNNFEEPCCEIEEKLLQAWKEVLRINSIGVTDNFFELGGDSIKAIQISSRLRKSNLVISVGNIMYYPTVREQANYVQVGKEIDQSVVEGEVLLTPIQKQFFDERKKYAHHYNHALAIHSPNGFDEIIIRKVFHKLLCHHDALRMVFSNIDGKITQFNKNTYGELFEMVQAKFSDTDFHEAILKETKVLQESFNLGKGPLVKLGLFNTPVGDYLVILIHHLVMDGVSWRILLEDFEIGYRQLMEGFDVVLQNKSNSFRDWSYSLQDYANRKEIISQLPYWKAVDDIHINSLPKTYIAQSNKVRDEESISISLSESMTELLLSKVNRAYNTETNDILLTALGLAFKDWTGEDKILISLEGHGRSEILEDIDVHRTIGWFTARYPVILNMEHHYDLSRQVKTIKEILRGVPTGGIGYGIIKYLSTLESPQTEQFWRKPEISFNYLGQFDLGISTDIFSISKLDLGSLVSQESERVYSLSINGYVEGAQLNFTLSYNKHEYSQYAVLSLMDSFKNHLQELIKHCSQKQDVELTPSDLGNRSLSLDEVDYIEDLFSTF